MTDTTQIHETYSLPYDGGVDADGHILEPLDLWQNYIDPKFRDRALRVEVDADDGLEYLVVDNKRPFLSGKGMVSTLGAMGAPDLRAIQFDPENTYERVRPYGTLDPKERLQVLDAENMKAAVIYTTGHGVEVDNTVYLLPGDYPLAEKNAALPTRALRLADIGAGLRAKRVNLLFYGGCRDNPLAP